MDRYELNFFALTFLFQSTNCLSSVYVSIRSSFIHQAFLFPERSPG
jgi:hypothetical protein